MIVYLTICCVGIASTAMMLQNSEDPAILTFVGCSFIDIGEIELGKECLYQVSSCQQEIDSDLLRIQSTIQKKILRLAKTTT